MFTYSAIVLYAMCSKTTMNFQVIFFQIYNHKNMGIHLTPKTKKKIHMSPGMRV